MVKYSFAVRSVLLAGSRVSVRAAAGWTARIVKNSTVANTTAIRTLEAMLLNDISIPSLSISLNLLCNINVSPPCQSIPTYRKIKLMSSNILTVSCLPVKKHKLTHGSPCFLPSRQCSRWLEEYRNDSWHVAIVPSKSIGVCTHFHYQVRQVLVTQTVCQLYSD